MAGGSLKGLSTTRGQASPSGASKKTEPRALVDTAFEDIRLNGTAHCAEGALCAEWNEEKKQLRHKTNLAGSSGFAAVDLRQALPAARERDRERERKFPAKPWSKMHV